jgi:hypothetical protein
MSCSLDPALLKDLTEAKAALARHGIVIIRTVETQLEPAIVAEVKDSLASSPRRLAQMKESDLDELMERVRETAMKSAEELKDLYTRLLAKLGTEYIVELVKELDGIDQLFKWDRIAKSVEPVNRLLDEKGFGPIQLSGPEDLSDGFKLELEERWNTSFVRFKLLAEQAAEQIKHEEEQEKGGPPTRQSKPRKKR